MSETMSRQLPGHCYRPDVEKAADFVRSLGISVRWVPATGNTFLPGIVIRAGGLELSEANIPSLGDVLHEAGHLAVVPALFRGQIENDVDESLNRVCEGYALTHPMMVETPEGLKEDPVLRGLMQAGEQEALAWQYAAAIAIGVDPMLAFADFSDGPDDICFGFQRNAHVGINGLTAGGMTTRRGFPAMLRWLQT